MSGTPTAALLLATTALLLSFVAILVAGARSGAAPVLEAVR